MDGKTEFVVIKKNEFNEFVVKTWDANRKRTPNSDYFTDDKKDAEETAKTMIEKK